MRDADGDEIQDARFALKIGNTFSNRIHHCDSTGDTDCDATSHSISYANHSTAEPHELSYPNRTRDFVKFNFSNIFPHGDHHDI